MTNSNGNYAKKLPPFTREAANAVMGRLSPADRRAVDEIIQAFPSQNNLLRLLLRLASGQIKTTFGNKSRVAIVGPANVGKSTLYNQLIQNKEDRAAVSPLPGTTRANQQADAGLFSVIDTPGADAVGEVGQREQQQALEAAAQSDFLVIMFDAIQGIKRTELELYDTLVGMGKPFVVVLNKIDLARKERDLVLKGVATALRLEPEQIIPIVARTGEGVKDVLIAISMTEPAIVAALGRAMPQFRWQLAWRSIVSGASASAVIALTPLPVIDFVPLIATQAIMVLGIARIYNYDITLSRARELVVTFGLGMLGRRLFQQLSKLGGLPGWLLSAAIAAASTVAIGYAAAIWFETGEHVSSDTMKRITGDLTKTLLDGLRGLGKRRPDKKSLREQIEQTLQDLPLGKQRKPSEPPPGGPPPGDQPPTSEPPTYP